MTSLPDEQPSAQSGTGYFERIAAEIRSKIAPERVMDLGCGAGALVKELRAVGIEAYGLDPDSEKVLAAGAVLQNYLHSAPLSSPLDGKYDLVTCLNVLHRLPEETIEEVLSVLADGTGDVLFAAPPPDYAGAEPAFPPDYWATVFAKHGFFHDLDFDASFIAPWAFRFRKRSAPTLLDAVEAYERGLWSLRRENGQLKDTLRETERSRDLALAENDPLMQTLTYRLKQWETTWADLEQSAGWKLLSAVRKFRLRFAPPGSRRAELLRLVRDGFGTLGRDGMGAFFRHWWNGLRSPSLRFAAGQKTIEQRNAEAYPGFVERTVLSTGQLDEQRAEAASWDWRPLISFITPVYQPPVNVLEALLESVLAQTYDRWELCIADASLQTPETRKLLQSYASRDDRIRLQLLEANLGICGNSNAALRMASGEYIAILDHDDLLAPDMLFEVARRIRKNPAVDVIYFDEDKLSADGTERREPFFKPDFAPEMLISANYLTHAVYRKRLVEDTGGFDPAFEGCQDWDLAFKVTERTEHIIHIPRVLYHWRQVSGSTAGEFGAKGYVFERQLRCVRGHLERLGMKNVQTSFPFPGFLRATWPVPGRKVSIIIPTKDKVAFLKRTIDSILKKTDYPDFEIVIVDNGSRQRNTLKYFAKLQDNHKVKIVDYNEKFNFSRANNIGAAHASGDLFLFLNNDMKILHADWLEELVRWAERPEIGIVGAKLLYPDDSIQHAGVIVGMEGHASHVFWGYRERQSGPFGSVDWYRNFTAVTGACMLIRRDTFEEIGSFSERYVLAFSDIELCKRAIDNGYRVVYTPFARLYHFEGKSRGDHIPSIDIRVGYDDLMALVESGDPFYNPNLSYIERKPLILSPDEEDRVARLRRVAARVRVDELTLPPEKQN